jgi:hypothetical protein
LFFVFGLCLVCVASFFSIIFCGWLGVFVWVAGKFFGF